MKFTLNATHPKLRGLSTIDDAYEAIQAGDDHDFGFMIDMGEDDRIIVKHSSRVPCGKFEPIIRKLVQLV
jgi:hypothetical protein